MPRMQADGGCKDITLGACKSEAMPFVNHLDYNEYFCRTQCKYDQRCEFFILDKITDICKLFDTSIKLFDDTCKIKGGPPSPDLEKCKMSDDGCTVSFIFRCSKILGCFKF